MCVVDILLVIILLRHILLVDMSLVHILLIELLVSMSLVNILLLDSCCSSRFIGSRLLDSCHICSHVWLKSLCIFVMYIYICYIFLVSISFVQPYLFTLPLLSIGSHSFVRILLFCVLGSRHIRSHAHSSCLCRLTPLFSAL